MSREASSSWAFSSSSRRLLPSSPSAKVLMRRSDSTRSLMSRRIALRSRSSPWPERPSENSTGTVLPSARSTSARATVPVAGSSGEGVPAGPHIRKRWSGCPSRSGELRPVRRSADRFTLRTRLLSSKVTIASKAVSNTASRRASPVEN